MKRDKRRTKIIITAGPACSTVAKMKAAIRAGADMIRINASHTSTQQLTHYVQLIRKGSKAAKKKVGILLDLQGPRLRTGSLEGSHSIFLREGGQIVVATGTKFGNRLSIAVPEKKFARMVKKGDRILLDNGTLALKALSVRGHAIRCKITRGG